MPNKFRKRDIERKGAKKEREKDMIMVNKNKEELAHPERTSYEVELGAKVEEID
jgi:hypothetical protein